MDFLPSILSCLLVVVGFEVEREMKDGVILGVNTARIYTVWPFLLCPLIGLSPAFGEQERPLSDSIHTLSMSFWWS